MHHDPRANTAVSGIANRFLYPVILLAIFAPTYVLIFDTKLDLNGDNARYYVLGKALSPGKGYDRYLITASEKNPDKFTLVHSLKNPGTWLLEF